MQKEIQEIKKELEELKSTIQNFFIQIPKICLEILHSQEDRSTNMSEEQPERRINATKIINKYNKTTLMEDVDNSIEKIRKQRRLNDFEAEKSPESCTMENKSPEFGKKKKTPKQTKAHSKKKEAMIHNKETKERFFAKIINLAQKCKPENRDIAIIARVAENPAYYFPSYRFPLEEFQDVHPLLSKKVLGDLKDIYKKNL